MKGEWRGVRAKLKYKREQPAIVSSDSESNVKIIEGKSLTPTATKKRKWQRVSSPRHDIDAPVPLAHVFTWGQLYSQMLTSWTAMLYQCHQHPRR